MSAILTVGPRSSEWIGHLWGTAPPTCQGWGGVNLSPSPASKSSGLWTQPPQGKPQGFHEHTEGVFVCKVWRFSDNWHMFDVLLCLSTTHAPPGPSAERTGSPSGPLGHPEYKKEQRCKPEGWECDIQRTWWAGVSLWPL